MEEAPKLKDFSQHFPDRKLTPHLSYSPAPSNKITEIFTPNFIHHPFILPKPSFYSPFPIIEETFIPTDQLMQMFFDTNNNNPQ